MSDKAANTGLLKCTEASEAESLEGNRELSLNRTWIYQHGRFPPCDPGVSTVKAQLWLSDDPFSIAMLWLGKEEKRKDQKKKKPNNFLNFVVLCLCCLPPVVPVLANVPLTKQGQVLLMVRHWDIQLRLFVFTKRNGQTVEAPDWRTNLNLFSMFPSCTLHNVWLQHSQAM